MGFSLTRCPTKEHQKQKKKTKGCSSTAALKAEKDVKPDLSSILEGLESTTVVPPKRRKRRRHQDIPIPTFAPSSRKRSDIFDVSVLLDSPLVEKRVEKRVQENNRNEIEDQEDKKPAPVKVGERASAALVRSVFDVSDDDSDLENIPSAPVFRKLKLDQKIKPEKSKEDQPGGTGTGTCQEETGNQTHVETKVSDVPLGEVELCDASSNNENGTSTPGEGNEMSQTRTLATTPKVAPTANASSTPLAQDKLFASLDYLYLQADINSVTVKDIIEALEAEYDTAMDKKTRKLIKVRLTSIISGKVIPMAASQSDFPPTPASTARSSVPTPSSTTRSDVRAPAVATAMVRPVKETKGDTRKKVEQPAEKTVRKVQQSRPAAPEITIPPAVPAPETAPVKRRTRATKKQQADGAASAMDGTKPAPAKRQKPRKRARKGNCSLCTTCPCSNVEGHASPVKIFGECTTTAAGRTEIEIEKSLIKRQKKLEKTVDKYESDLDLVTRELKKHRRVIVKRKGAQLQHGREQAFGDSRFLPDAWDVHFEQQKNVVIAISDVEKAQRKMFGTVKGGQPTLTQMMGGGDGESEKEKGELAPIMEEPELAPSQNSDAFYLQEDDEQSIDSEAAKKEEAADNFQRVSWRDGKQGETNEAPGQPVWSAMSSGKPATAKLNSVDESSAWDRIFSTGVRHQSVGGGFDELLGLFDSEAPGLSLLSQRSVHLEVDKENHGGEAARINVSQLSQPAQDLAESIEGKVMADPVKLARIEGACPNWKENIRFALLQRGEDDIQAALTNIQESKVKLDKMREDFLAAWGRQQTVMHLFELSLSASLQRVNGTERATGIIEDDVISGASSEIESDVETVTEFSPMSQEEPASAIKAIDPEHNGIVMKPDPVKSRIFQGKTQEQAQEDEVPSNL